jgi:hypothetical protein
MTNSKHILSALGVAIAMTLPAYAQQADAPKPPTTAPTAATAPATPDTEHPAPSPDTIRKARMLGMRPEKNKAGDTVYCWNDADTGTHFTTKKCIGEDRLQEAIERRQALVDQVHRGMTGTSGGK